MHAQQARDYYTNSYGKARGLINGVRRNAKNHSVKCSLTFEWIKEKIDAGCCEISGIKFELSLPERGIRRNPYGPSIDRKVAGSDYTPDNCRVILLALNIAINEWGEDVYCDIADKFLGHRAIQREKHAA